MTLRTRLTVAFLAVVLGPVLLSAAFVGGTVTAVNADRATYRLDLAAEAVRAEVGSLCRQLRAQAGALATRPAPERGRAAAAAVGRPGLTAVQVRDAGGRTVVTAGVAPPLPWADCGLPRSGAVPRALAAVAPVAGTDGGTGRVWALVAVDDGLLDRLAVPGVTVEVAPAAGPAAGATDGRDRVRLTDGRWVRRLEPAVDQPLPLLLTTPGAPTQGLLALLVVVVVVAGLAAVAAAWWLARSSTRPLTALARAADRVADGDLSTRVPVTGDDEAGRVAAAFNRMTQRMQAYVTALTASRDQLRGHLLTLGDTLSSTHDLPRILRVILRTALVATGARAGAVALLDERGQTLTGYYAGPVADGAGRGATGGGEPAADPGRAAPEPAGSAVPAGSAPPAGPATDQEAAGYPPTVPLQVPLSGSLLGGVALSGVAARGRIDPPGRRHPDEPACRTYVVAPISVPDAAASHTPPWPVPRAVRGVLALYDRFGGEDFDDADLAALRTFAGQAAVAVENVRVHEEAQRLSLTDPLTGLWNYRYLRDVLRREVERASRFGRSLAVLALDLDRFKEVNDAYGHPAGDAVLLEFTRRIRSGIREMDVAFRQGGEEFVVLLPETDARGAAAVARRLGSAVRDAPMVVVPRGSSEERRIDITVSIGIAVFPDHARTPQGILDAADDALYAAKAAGRDTYRMAPPEHGGAVAAELAVRGTVRIPDDDLPRAGGGWRAAVQRSGATRHGQRSGTPPRSGGSPRGDTPRLPGEAKPPRQPRGR
ncbi:MAG: diguanylate cyclase [Micromonosporaceae bacterium]